MEQNEQRALLVSIGALAFSTLALASAPRWATCITAAMAVLAVVPLAGSRRILAKPQPLLLLLLIPLLATAFQLLPLPSALVGLIAPARYALAEANAHAYGHALPGTMPLSQDWPATLVELAKFAGYFAFAYVCTRLCASRRARRWLLMTVAVVGMVVALCALGHQAVGAKTLLGLYAPDESAYTQSLSPFLNPNHLAGYMAFVTPLCLGLAAQRRSWLFLLMAALCAFASLQALSRGGVISLSVGVMVVLLLVARSQRGQRGRGPAVYWIALAVGLALAALALLFTNAGQEVLNLDLQREVSAGKILSWRSAPGLLETSPWFGIGRGAFEFSYTQFQPPIAVTFSHIENEYLQAVLDWGVPIALAMALALGLLIRAVIRRGVVDAMAAGGIGALTALAIQSFVDFSLELPGMALPAIAVAATLLESKLVVVADKSKRKWLPAYRLVPVAVSVALCALAASALGARPDEDIAAATELRVGYGGDRESMVAAAARIAGRHPSSYLLPATTAKVLWHRRDSAAFDVMARALALNSNHSGVHLLAAQMLSSSQQPRQAIAEYRAALALAGPSVKIMRNLEADFPGVDDLILGIPGTGAEARFGTGFLKIGRADAAEALARRALQRGETSFDIHKVGVQAALANQNATWAVEVGRSAHELFGTDESLLLYVSALRAASLPLVAIEALMKSPASNDSSGLELLDVLSVLQLEVHDLPAARETSEKLMRSSGTSIQHRRIAHLRLASIEEQRGNAHQATWHRQQASDLVER